MPFAHPRRIFHLVVLLLAFLLAFPVLAFAGQTGTPSRAPQAGLAESGQQAESHVNMEPLFPGDRRAELLKQGAKNVPEQYLAEELKPDKVAGPAFPGGGEAGGGGGGWSALARVYGTKKDPNLEYRLEDSVTDNNGRTHFIYSVMRDVTLTNPGNPDRDVTLYDVYYRAFKDGAWSETVNLTSRAGDWMNIPSFFDVDGSGTVHFIYSRDEWVALSSGDWETDNGSLNYMYLAPGGSWSTARTLMGTGGDEIEGTSFRLVPGAAGQLEGIRGSVMSVNDRGEPYPYSYRASISYLAGYMDDWAHPFEVEAWDFSIAEGSKVPFYSPRVEVSGAGEEVIVSWTCFILSGTSYMFDGKTTTRERRTSGGNWLAVRAICTSPMRTYNMPLLTGFRQNTNQAISLYVQSKAHQDETTPPKADIFIAYWSDGRWLNINLSNVGDRQQAWPDFLNEDPAGLLSLVFTVETMTWDSSWGVWKQTSSKVMYRAEDAPRVIGRAKTVAGNEAGIIADDVTSMTDADGGVHVVFARTTAENTSNRLYYSVMPAGKEDFEDQVLLQGPTDKVFDYDVLSVLPGGRVLNTWMEYGFHEGVQDAGSVVSRLKDNGVWKPSVLVSRVPGNQMVMSIEGGYPYFYEISTTFFNTSPGRHAVTGEQQAVFEMVNFDGSTYTNPRLYWSQTTNGMWSDPELIYAGSPVIENPYLDADINGRSQVLGWSTDPNTDQRIALFTEQKDATPPPATYFAEGCTRDGFVEYLCIENDNYTRASVSITYMLENGETPVQQLEVAPRSRATIDVRSFVGSGHDVAAKVSSDQVVGVERPMYFDQQGRTGGSTTLGVPSPMQIWYFAEGTTRDGFQEYLTLQNPSGLDTEVTVSYIASDGKTTDQQVGVPAHSRVTRDVNKDVGPGKDISMIVRSPGAAVVAERPMYFNYKGLTGGSDVTGSPRIGQEWYFAEGTTRDNATDGQYDAFLAVQNPTAVNANVFFRFLMADGTVKQHSMMVPATCRQTLNVKDVLGVDKDFSTAVTSDTTVLVERSTYFNYRNKWTGGASTIGADSPRNAWYFPEGTTRDGFDEWITIENTGGVPGTATIKYITVAGQTLTQQVAVAAHSRVTVDVALFVGRGQDVSSEIWCDQGMIVERPMYFDFNGWTGGHSIIGL